MAAQRLRLVFLSILACLSASLASAQGGAFNGQVVTTQGYPAALAPVRVCSYTSSGNPCTPLSSVYQDPALTVPDANPVIADQYGNYSFFLGAGVYIVQITPSPGITYSYLVTSYGGVVSFLGETPSGAIDGSNRVFTLSQSPGPTSALIFTLNGLVELPGTSYTLSGVTITMVTAPQAGDTVFAYYPYQEYP